MKGLLYFALVFSLSAQATPGGAIKIGDKIYTLAEAGLKIEDPQTPYFPDDETIQATVAVTDKIGAIMPTAYRTKLRDGIFGNTHRYQKAAVVDQALFLRMQEEYAKHVAQLPVTGTFTLLAYTEGSVTYLFPDFFAATPETRALILVHESAFFMNPQATLENVLRLEIATVEFLAAPEDWLKHIGIYNAFEALKLFDKLQKDEWFAGTKKVDVNTGFALYLKTLIRHGVDLRLSHFVAPGTSLGLRCGDAHGEYYNPARWIATDAVILNQHRGIEAGFFRRFYQQSVLFDHKRFYPYTDDAYRKHKGGKFDIGCGLINKTAENFRISVREDAKTGRPVIYVMAIDESPAPFSLSEEQVPAGKIEFFRVL